MDVALLLTATVEHSAQHTRRGQPSEPADVKHRRSLGHGWADLENATGGGLQRLEADVVSAIELLFLARLRG